MRRKTHRVCLALFCGNRTRCVFRAQVRPGDTLRLELDVISLRRSICKMSGKAYVGSKLAAESGADGSSGEKMIPPDGDNRPESESGQRCYGWTF